jgi:hypothetical protein
MPRSVFSESRMGAWPKAPRWVLLSCPFLSAAALHFVSNGRRKREEARGGLMYLHHPASHDFVPSPVALVQCLCGELLQDITWVLVEDHDKGFVTKGLHFAC